MQSINSYRRRRSIFLIFFMDDRNIQQSQRSSLAKPQVLEDTKVLAILLDDLQQFYPHKYKYGWGNDLQRISAELFEAFHASQTLLDFNQRVVKLQIFLYKLDTLCTLLEIICSRCALPDTKINQIYRLTDKIAKQIKGLRSYFANMASGQNQMRR